MLRTALVCSVCMLWPWPSPHISSDQGLTVSFGVTISPQGSINLNPSAHPEESIELDQSFKLRSADLYLTPAQEVATDLYLENTEIFEFPSDLESVTSRLMDEATED
ncbi:hypothetical protein TREES_T100006340 [Tupaia chinensis]|uniref:Uncharacterized protein n=1 Tax=Tupaia chinensis TaxID=246437 RepID=L9L4V0_TUPCH|nr:hypothetical protein TREES_T100006340 [Tupaia chinensis]